MSVIAVAGARKTYRRWRRPSERAVDGLDLTVEEGGVFGFLGPNGSGKTTTIRMLLGLVYADAGQLSVFGRPVPEGLPDIVDDIGALVETPLFFPNFSGRLNLELLAGIAGLPRTRVDEVLEQVGLAARGDDRVKGYSLGMRQRLGIAAALLKRPRLLILDEPTNGLDPAGIREIRELIRALGSGGTTVFLSSHLLGEVEQVCDRVAILSRGRCIVSGSVKDVLATRSTGELRVAVDDAGVARDLLAAAGIAATAIDATALAVTGVGDPAQVTEVLARQGVYLRELSPVAVDLESVFLGLTQDAE
ncbi:MAG TPA: ABC transporter ATP-binding protein [Mycobacteriales bacterium]|jgi:ABC-2 type transport system ATP-binding protein|nr:ABC transporter ATP-binding protein [Mycobacteriales bacterium]